MRKIIFCNLMTIDGFFEGPQQEIDWHYADEEHDKFAVELLNSVDTMIFGRKTYQLMEKAWAHASTQSSPIVKSMNELPKLVFSRTLEKVEWENSRLAQGAISDEVATIKKQPGKDVVILGSAELAASFMKLRLIDEYQILLNPILLGKGNPLFKEMDERMKLSLIRSKVRKNGVVELYYRNQI
ncbi:dihydrofolate reductase family protein [Bdellovibrio svalbardensis]|uniref:Dihydrofolate reductase family protein n=1 Tax=Bdellovibrio svalbardensis TaxID=2972972 RepID=A0ABT6DFB7_9BACT|nr:dihydrofolate reductase family protein [Bdellovibrio svalbardensis]MDG0815162.1 dihydrofolate reductase family protein [Bdellovibrio svalbardensis]